MSDVVALEFTSPSGEDLRVEWPVEALTTVDSDAPRAWRLAGEIDWDEVEALRVLTASLSNNRSVALTALRPAGAPGHGDELVAAALLSDGEVNRLDEALLSTEYGPDGLPRRVGLELYRRDDPVPLRAAGDVEEVSSSREGGVQEVRATLTVRRDGSTGAGLIEILTPA